MKKIDVFKKISIICETYLIFSNRLFVKMISKYEYKNKF